MVLHNPELLPLIPEGLLRAHHVHLPYDTRFRAASRLLQALWRERQRLPPGHYTQANGKRRQLGSRLDASAARAGANFLSPATFGAARMELQYQEPGALYDAERMWSNLLSSAPLCFNLLTPLKQDKALARRVFKKLIPEAAGHVAHIQFETAPGRGDPSFLSDGTSFDALVTLRAPDRAKTFIAIETKYSEGMTEPEARLRPRYDEVAHSSGLYKDPADPALRQNPIASLWRGHMLAQTMVDADLFDRGVFLLIAPRQNREVQRAARAYARRLADAPGKVAFVTVDLEDAIAALDAAGATDLAAGLRERYTDFGPVHQLVRDHCLTTPRRRRPLHPTARRAPPQRPARQPKSQTSAAGGASP